MAYVPAPADAGAARIRVLVTTTYLALERTAWTGPPGPAPPEALVLPARPSVPYYRFLYDLVGRDYAWVNRLTWSDEQLDRHLQREAVTVLVLHWQGTPAGYVELDRESEEPGTEIVYFGLAPTFHGRDLGRYLLQFGAARAFEDGAARVWLHTCNLDGQWAIANYQARGFRPYRVHTATEELPADRLPPHLRGA